MDLKDISFKIILTLFAFFYYLYALVISKQVKIMDRTLQDEHNGFILFITSLQVTLSLILLIVLILSIFLT